jgi:UDP-N-acetylglucosamine 3-dehydrogenase
MPKKAKVGIIGTGFWGRNHARVLHELEHTDLIAVCDINQAIAKAISEKYNADWHSQSETLLKRDDIDAVCICTPTVTHTEIALKAIRYDKHILIEKPIASNVKQAERILLEADKRRVFIMTGFIERFNPGVRRVKNAIEGGDVGKVVLATSHRVGLWPERIGDIGVIKDSAIHDIDIMRFIFDENPSTIYARAGSLDHRFEDYAQIMLSFSGLKTAFIEANWLTPHKVRNLTVTGNKGKVNVDYLTQEVVLHQVGKVIKQKHTWVEPLKLELEHFGNCIISNIEPDVTGIDGLRALQIAEAALDSSKKGMCFRLQYND